MPLVFYHSVIHGLGFFFIFVIKLNIINTNVILTWYDDTALLTIGVIMFDVVLMI